MGYRLEAEMNDRDFLILKYLSEFQNITKAAEALFISQPALTARIKQLELELDTKLIQSSNKGVYLTQTGMTAAAFAGEMLKKIDELKESIKVIEGKDADVIKIMAPVIITRHYLPALIDKYREQHRKTKFEITSVSSSTVARLMKENRCHIGFIRNDFGWGEDERHLLGTNYIAAVSMTPFEIADLPNMNRVDYKTDPYYQKMLNTWWKKTFATNPRVDILVDSLELCRVMVYRGLGFGLLPSVFLPECPSAYSHILKNKQGNPIERNTWLVYNQNSLKNKPVMEFIDFIKQNEFSDFLRLTIH